MASTYTVKNHQNIFDVAVQLYGSIEGLFDLLMTNDNLNMNDVLVEGQELLYHPEYIIKEEVASTIKKTNTVIANGEGEGPILRSARVLGSIILEKKNAGLTSFNMAGSGSIQIDWGDNSIGEYTLSAIEQPITHQYYSSGKYTVYIYGEGSIKVADMKGVAGTFYPIHLAKTLEKYCEDSDLLAENTCITLFSTTIFHHLEWKNRTGALPIASFLNPRIGLQYLDITGSNVSAAYLSTYLQNVYNNRAKYTTLTCYFDAEQVNSACKTHINNILSDSTYGKNFKFYVDGKLLNS